MRKMNILFKNKGFNIVFVEKSDFAFKSLNFYCFIFFLSWRNMAMRRIFWFFFRNWVLIDPLHCLTSRSAFGFEFAEIFVIEKRLPDSPSRRLPDSPSRRVTDSPSRGVGFWMFKRKTRRVGVGDSLTRLIGESLTPRLSKSESRRLPDTASHGVAMVSRGVAIQIF